MYPVTANDITAYRNNMNVAVAMTIEPITGTTISVTNADIVMGSMKVTRSCSIEQGIGFGVVTASLLQFSLMNYNGQFTNFKFAGAKIYASTSVTDINGTHVVPLGYFTIDYSPKIRETIDIEAIDNMAWFDKDVDLSWFTFPMTLQSFLESLCAGCNFTPSMIDTDLSLIDNASYIIHSAPSDVTCRQLLSWACEIACANAYIDWNGHLCLGFYEDALIDPNDPTSRYNTLTSDRFNSELEDYVVTYTGVSVENGENRGFYGSDGYVLTVEGNDLIDHDLNLVAASMYSKLSGVPYVPFMMKSMPAPYLYPLDVLTYTDANNNTYTVLITDCEYTVGSLSMIEGKGESPQVMSYAALNAFTSQERVIVKTLGELNKTLNTRVQSVLDFNNLITNSLGLYYTDVTNADGSVTRYMHDKPALNDSMQIYTLTANGIAWTDTGWNGGSPVWTYGVTSAGFALFKRLSAEGIDVQSANTNYHVEITPSAFKVYYLATEVMSIVADELTVPKAKIDALDLGGLRFVAVKSGSTIVGTDVYWIGG